jgi:hypothetical protein
MTYALRYWREGLLQGLFTLRPLPTPSVERFQSLESQLAALRCRMHVPLGHSDAGMSRQPHDCKCICSRFTQPGEELMAEPMKNELSGEENDFFPVHYCVCRRDAGDDLGLSPELECPATLPQKA